MYINSKALNFNENYSLKEIHSINHVAFDEHMSIIDM